MRDFSTPRTYIVSAYQGKSAAHDRAAHCELSCDLALEGVPFRACEGNYKGQYEQAFIVVGAEHGAIVRALAQSYNQETYLVIAEHDRTAYLVDTVTGCHKHLGPFRAVGCDQPETDAWTLLDGTFFTTSNTEGVDLPRGF